MEHTDSRVLVDALFGRTESKTDERISGVVTKVDGDGTVWVRLAGSQTSTPCTRTTTDSKTGDSVSVIVRNGCATIEGNYTAPAATSESVSRKLRGIAAAQKIASRAQELASNAVAAASATKSLAASAQKAADSANKAIEPVYNDLQEIKGEEKTFLDGLEKKINTMTAGFAASTDLASVKSELETSISQTAQKIEMIASSDTALQLSEDAQAKLQQANEDLAVAQVRLDAAMDAHAEALASYNQLVASGDATEEQIAEALQAVTDAKNTLDLAQATYDNAVKIINGIKTNYTSKTQFELLAEGLRLLFSKKSDDELEDSDDRDSYITLTSGGIRLGDVGNTNAYLNIASDAIAFHQNGIDVATITGNAMHITRVQVTDELAVENWHWKQRDNGNISFKYREGDK